jgi:hypothetical protein
VRVGAAAVTVLTAHLHVDRAATEVKCWQRELLARLCYAWNVYAAISQSLPRAKALLRGASKKAPVTMLCLETGRAAQKGA